MFTAYNDETAGIDDFVRCIATHEIIGNGPDLLFATLDQVLEIPERTELGEWWLIYLCAESGIGMVATNPYYEMVKLGDPAPTATYKKRVAAWSTRHHEPVLQYQYQKGCRVQYLTDAPWMNATETRINCNNIFHQFDAKGMFPPGHCDIFYVRMEAENFVDSPIGFAQQNVFCGNGITHGMPLGQQGSFTSRAQSKGNTRIGQPEVYDDMIPCIIPPGPLEGKWSIVNNTVTKGFVHGSGFELRDEAIIPYVAPPPPPPPEPGEHPGGWVTGSAGTRFGNLDNNAGAWHDGVSNVPIGGPNPAAALRTNATSLFFGAAIVPSGRIKRFEITGSNNDGYVSNATPQVTIKCYGKVGSQPTGPGDCMLLGTMPPFTDTANESAWRGLDTSDQTYFDHFAYEVIQGGGAANMAIGEARVEIRAG